MDNNCVFLYIRQKSTNLDAAVIRIDVVGEHFDEVLDLGVVLGNASSPSQRRKIHLTPHKPA